jgi:hypothetical protein
MHPALRPVSIGRVGAHRSVRECRRESAESGDHLQTKEKPKKDLRWRELPGGSAWIAALP